MLGAEGGEAGFANRRSDVAAAVAAATVLFGKSRRLNIVPLQSFAGLRLDPGRSVGKSVH